MNEKLFDVRVVERNLKKGLIKAEDVKQRVESLADVADNAEPTELVQPGFEADEDAAESAETTDGGSDEQPSN